MPEPIHIEIYSRPGCHLCDEAWAIVEKFRQQYPMTLRSINVEHSADLESRYGAEIPVVFINGEEVFRHRINRTEMERKLKAQWNK